MNGGASSVNWLHLRAVQDSSRVCCQASRKTRNPWRRAQASVADHATKRPRAGRACHCLICHLIRIPPAGRVGGASKMILHPTSRCIRFHDPSLQSYRVVIPPKAKQQDLAGCSRMRQQEAAVDELACRIAAAALHWHFSCSCALGQSTRHVYERSNCQVLLRKTALGNPSEAPLVHAGVVCDGCEEVT